MFHPWLLPTLAFRPWRLLSELDDFPDGECRVFIRKLVLLRYGLLVLAFPIAMLIGLAFIYIAEEVGTRAFGIHSPILDTSTFIGRAVASVFAIGLLTIGITAAFIPYCYAMRFAIRRLLRRVGCPHCGYSLLGLAFANGAVRCPECGQHVNLADHGLAPQDILAGVRRRPASERNLSRPSRVPIVASLYLAGTLAVWTASGSEDVLTWSLIGGLMALGFSATRMAAGKPES